MAYKFRNKAIEAEYRQVMQRAREKDEETRRMVQGWAEDNRAQALQNRTASIDERAFGVARPAWEPPVATRNPPIVREWQGPLTQGQLIEQATKGFTDFNQRYDDAAQNYREAARRETALLDPYDPLSVQRAGTDAAAADRAAVQNEWYQVAQDALWKIGPEGRAKLEQLVKDDAAWKEANPFGGYRDNSMRNELEELYGKELVDNLTEYIRQVGNAEVMAQRKQEAHGLGKKSGTAVAATVPARLISGIEGTAGMLAQKGERLFSGSRAPLDWNDPSQTGTNVTGAVREGATSELGPVGKFLANTAFSVADSAAAAALGPFGAPLLATAAANASMQEAKARGASDDQAIALGLISGVAEAVTEKVSIDHLFSLKNPDSVKDILMNGLKQAFPEMSEEAASSVINLLADEVIMGNQSRYQEMIRNGMTSGEALLELAKEVGLDSLAGALSGFVIGSGRSAGVYGVETVTGERQARRTADLPQVDTEEAAVPTAEEQREQGKPAEIPEPASYVPELATVSDMAAQKGAAEAILNSGYLDGLVKNGALDATGIPRGRMRQALRSIARGDTTKIIDSDVQAVLTAMKQGDIPVSPVQETQQPIAEQVMQGEQKLPEVAVGAKRNSFKTAVVQDQNHALEGFEARNNIPEELRTPTYHDRITEQESLHNARLRVDQDMAGEQSHLRNTVNWTGEDVDAAMMILEDLAAESKETGDWSKYLEWRKTVDLHKEEIGRSLQALSKYARLSGERILMDAAKSLENARKSTDTSAVMDNVSAMADRFDVASETKSVPDFVSIVKDAAKARNTGGILHRKGLSAEVGWALDRIAELAQNDLNNYKASGSQADGNGKYYDFLRTLAANSATAIATDKAKVSVGKVVKTVRYNAMLSKSSTVLRNLYGNVIFDGLDTVARDAAVPLDMLISKLTGTRSVGFDKGVFSQAKRQGTLNGLAMALLQCGLDVDVTHIAGKYEKGSVRTAKESGGALERLLSKWEMWTAYTMTATDEGFKGGTEAEIQRGLDELYAQRKITDDSLKDGGTTEARYRTFQDENWLSNSVVGTRDSWNHGADFGVGDMAVPFARVPTNLAARIYDYSPAGLVENMARVTKIVIDAKNGKNAASAAQQAKAVQGVTRGMTGSVLIAGFAVFAAKGIIRVVSPGGKEENRDKAASEAAEGFYGTQWNLSSGLRYLRGESADWQPGDDLISIGFLDPINAHMAIGALIAEDMQDEDGLTAKEILGDSAAGLAQAVFDLPVMQTIQDAVIAGQQSDADNLGGIGLDVAKAFGASLASSFIPNAVKGIAQGLDDTQRDLYTKDGWMQQVFDDVKGSFPGSRETLPAKLDVYGNEVKNEGGFKNFFNANVNPGSVTKYKPTETQEILNRISEETGDNTIYLSKTLPKTVTVDKQNVKLTNDQQRAFSKNRGDIYESVVPALDRNTNFASLPGKAKTAALNYAEDYATQFAKESLGVGYEADSWVQDLMDATPEEVASACIKRGVDRIGGLGTPITFDPSWAVVSSDVMKQANSEAQKYADALALEEMGYPIETGWITEAKELKTDRERQDFFVARAVSAQAESMGKKYDGLSEMLDSGAVTNDVAFLCLPGSIADSYMSAKATVPVDFVVEVLRYQNSEDGKGENGKDGKYLPGKSPKEKTIRFIDSLNTTPANKKQLKNIFYKQ